MVGAALHGKAVYVPKYTNKSDTYIKIASFYNEATRLKNTYNYLGINNYSASLSTGSHLIGLFLFSRIAIKINTNALTA